MPCSSRITLGVPALTCWYWHLKGAPTPSQAPVQSRPTPPHAAPRRPTCAPASAVAGTRPRAQTALSNGARARSKPARTSRAVTREAPTPASTRSTRVPLRRTCLTQETPARRRARSDSDRCCAPYRYCNFNISPWPLCLLSAADPRYSAERVTMWWVGPSDRASRKRAGKTWRAWTQIFRSALSGERDCLSTRGTRDGRFA